MTGENDGMSLYERPGTGRRTEVDAPSRWVRAGVVTVGFVAVLYVLEAVDQLTNNSLDPYGIQPRSEDGLVGIALAPLLHGSWGQRLREVFDSIEDPVWDGSHTEIPLRIDGRTQPLKKLHGPDEKLI